MGQMMKLLKEKDPVLHKHLVGVTSLISSMTTTMIIVLCCLFSLSRCNAHSKRLGWIQHSLVFGGSLCSSHRSFYCQVTISMTT